MPEAKTRATFDACNQARETAMRTGNWAGYDKWLVRQATTLERQAERQGTLA
jgi:hypothetical protein